MLCLCVVVAVVVVVVVVAAVAVVVVVAELYFNVITPPLRILKPQKPLLAF